MLAATTIEVPEGGYRPAIIFKRSTGEAAQFPLEGVFEDAGEAIGQAIAAIDAMRAALRGPAPVGFPWG